MPVTVKIKRLGRPPKSAAKHKRLFKKGEKPKPVPHFTPTEAKKKGPPKGVRYGGRKPGAPLKRTREARQMLLDLEQELGRPVDPLEFLLRVSADEAIKLSMRIDCAKAACPYLYPKLQVTQVSGEPGGEPIQHDHNFDLKRLKPEELEMMDSMLARAEKPLKEEEAK